METVCRFSTNYVEKSFNSPFDTSLEALFKLVDSKCCKLCNSTFICTESSVQKISKELPKEGIEIRCPQCCGVEETKKDIKFWSKHDNHEGENQESYKYKLVVEMYIQTRKFLREIEKKIDTISNND